MSLPALKGVLLIAEKIRGLVDAGEDPNEIANPRPRQHKKNITPTLPYLEGKKSRRHLRKRDNRSRMTKLVPHYDCALCSGARRGKVSLRSSPASEILFLRFLGNPRRRCYFRHWNHRASRISRLLLPSGDERFRLLLRILRTSRPSSDDRPA